MNFLKIMQSKYNICSLIAPKLISEKIITISSVTKHVFSNIACKAPVPGFLQPPSVCILPSCGLKIKGILRRRCKDCYFVRREGRMYVMCHSFPRHKQTNIMPAEKRTWIFSHACQSKQRPY